MVDDDAKRAFGAAVKRALDGHGQDWLAEQIGVTQGAVSRWIVGSNEPPHETVFAIERVLGQQPGVLSRLLGYVPADAVPARSVVEAIEADPRLDNAGRRALLTLYGHYVDGDAGQ